MLNFKEKSEGDKFTEDLSLGEDKSFKEKLVFEKQLNFVNVRDVVKDGESNI